MADMAGMLAGALSVISTVGPVMSVLSSIVATLNSSAYETKRLSRELKEVNARFEKLQECLYMLGDEEQWSWAPSRASRPAERECRTVLQCQTLLQHASSAAAILPSKAREMSEHYGWVTLARHSQPIEAHCRPRNPYTPLFGKAQSWIAETVVDHLPSKLFMIPWAEDPTPEGLLLSWVVLAVAIAIYYSSQPRIRSGGYCVTGSLLAACVIGVLEGSGLATVILMDMPWCLTIGMLLHGIASGISMRLAAVRRWRDAGPSGLQLRALSQDVEKGAGDVVCQEGQPL